MSKSAKQDVTQVEHILRLIAQEFLVSDANVLKLEELAQLFQSEIRHFYETIKPLTDKTDEQGILDDITLRFKPTENTASVPATARMFPKHYFRHLVKDGSLECTLASAMFKLAMEENGYDNVFTVLLQGHQIAMRELANGGITLYDPSTSRTESNGSQHGFSETFTADEVVDKTSVYDEQGKFRGTAFTIQTTRKINHTGMFEDYSADTGTYSRKFFASEPNTLIELSIALDNLGDLSDKDKYKSLVGFDAKQTIEKLGLFNPKPTYYKV